MRMRKRFVLEGSGGNIILERNEHGIPVIRANIFDDLAYGLGYAHAMDRQLHVLLTRILVQGRAAEFLAGTPELVEIDRFMRRVNFLPDADTEIKKLTPEVKTHIQAYIDGFNYRLAEKGAVTEFKLLGYKPEPLTMSDVLVMAKIMGFIGLGDAQGNMEKLIVQMVQNGIDERKIRELFPYLTDKIDYDLMKKISLRSPMAPEALRWFQRIPKFIASNNWVVSGKLTQSGKPILCNDPHLEINRIPSVWYETVMKLPHETIIGASLPGAPGILIGRNKNIAVGVTFAFMDMIDFMVEHCREGKYRRGKKWLPFKVREEQIKVKKGETVTERVYENDLGTLEGDPTVEGYYLLMRWAAARDCGAGDMHYIRVMRAGTVKEAMDYYRNMEAGSWNMVIADSGGNIGYRMTGRLFRRPPGASGLIPLPAWNQENIVKGFVHPDEFPIRYNPPEGYIVTANQNLNAWGKCRPINLPMASYRADRITEMLKEEKKADVQYMKRMHYDLRSKQAELFMEAMKPLIPDTENGRLLKSWDCRYTDDSLGAMLFESVYIELVLSVFGDHGLGREIMSYLLNETGLFNDYYGNFDSILMRHHSTWFGNMDRDTIFRHALDKGLAVRAVPYGKTRKVTISHLLFGGKLPKIFGFDRGPVRLPGSRATIPQGQIFRSAGRTTTFSPSFRFICDLSTEEAHTNLAGGPSDRRFSSFYFSDFKNSMNGVYKILS